MNSLLQDYVKGNTGGNAAPTFSGNPYLSKYVQSYVPPKVVAPPPAPKPSPSILQKSVGGWSLGRVLTDIGHGAKSTGGAIAAPVVDVAKGQGGKSIHDIARLSSDVTGGSANYLANQAFANPTREIAAYVTGNKVAERNATTKSNISLGLGAKGTNIGSGLKKFGGEAALAGLSVVGGGEAAGLKGITSQTAKGIAKAGVKNAGIGAGAGAAYTVASNPNAKLKDIVKGAALGGTLGGISPLATKALGAAISRAKGALPLPRSALDKHIVEDTAEVPKAASTASVKATRPLNDLQTQIEKAHNSGDTKLETKLVKQLPDQGMNPNATLTPERRAELMAKMQSSPTKISGSALRTEAKAVEAGMKGELPEKATYNTQSYKAEAENAVKLLKENPDKAHEIAMGRQAGNNASHEAAVYHAVANDALAQAKKTGDYSKVTELASSPRHAGVSEAAQRLGAEGYNVTPHDPIKIMNDVAATRQKAVGTSVAKEATNIGKQVKSSTIKVSRQDWHSFVNSLACKE